MRQVSYSYVSFLVMQLINYVVNNNNNNNRVRYLQNNQNILQQNQDIMFNTINNMIGTVCKLTKNHNETKNELDVVEYFINDLHKDLQTLKDSLKHIEEERLHSDDDFELDGDDNSHDVVLDYPDTSSPISPTSEGNKDSDGLDHDEEDLTNYMMSSATDGSSSSSAFETSTLVAVREEYPVDYSEYDTEGKIYYIH